MLRGVSSNIASISQMFRQKDKKPTFCTVGSPFLPDHRICFLPSLSERDGLAAAVGTLPFDGALWRLGDQKGLSPSIINPSDALCAGQRLPQRPCAYRSPTSTRLSD